MTGVRLALAAVATLAVALWLFFPADGGRRATSAGDPRAAAPSAPAQIDPSPRPGPAAPLGEPAVESPRQELPDAGPDSEPTVAAPEGQATVLGRFLLPGGEAAAGIPVLLHGWVSNDELALYYGVPEDWVDPRTLTGDDGRFRLTFAPPRAFQFFLAAEAEGYPGLSWRWSEIRPDQVLDLGEVTFAPGGVVEGRVLGTRAAGWEVSTSQVGPREGDRESHRGHVSVDPTSRVFRVHGVPAGRVSVEARHDLADKSLTRSVEVVAGGKPRRWTSPTSARPSSAASRWSPRPVRSTSWASPRPPRSDCWVPTACPAGRRRSRASARCSSTISPPVPTGSRSRTPGSSPGPEPTSKRERASWRGSRGAAALQLDVRDPRGQAIELYGLRVRFRGVAFRPDEFLVHDGREPLDGGRFPGMFPGDYTLTVRAKGLGVAPVDVNGLEAGETRRVQVSLGAPTRVAGRVSQGGREAAEVQVSLLRAAAEDDSEASPVVLRGGHSTDPRARREIDLAITGPDGRFELFAPAGGSFALRAQKSPKLRTTTPAFAVATGETVDRDLILPQLSRLVGRVVGLGAPLPADLRIWVAPVPGDPEEIRSLDEEEVVTLDAAGVFESPPLLPGEVDVLLLPPARYLRGSTTILGRPAGARVIGRVTLPEGETVTETFPLGDHCPGVIDIAVRDQGLPVAGARLTLFDEDGSRLHAVTDPIGLAEPLPAFPGLWTLLVKEADEAWTYWHSTPLIVAPGTPLVLEIDPQLSRGHLTLVEAEGGALLAECNLRLEAISREHPRRTWSRSVVTDLGGKLHLTLPRGEYRFVLDLDAGKAGPVREATVRWGPDGPDRDPLEL